MTNPRVLSNPLDTRCIRESGRMYTQKKIFLRFIYLFMIDREAETQEEGEAGSMPGAQRGTRSRDSRIAPQAKGRR